MNDRDVSGSNRKGSIPNQLTTRTFIYNLLRKKGIDEPYNSIRVTGLGGGNNLVIEVKNDDETIRKTKPSALERYEIPEEGEDSTIKHAIFQLLHRRGRTINAKYNEVVFTDPGKNKHVFHADLLLNGQKMGEVTLEEVPDAERGVTRTARYVDYSQDPWEEDNKKSSKKDKTE